MMILLVAVKIKNDEHAREIQNRWIGYIGSGLWAAGFRVGRHTWQSIRIRRSARTCQRQLGAVRMEAKNITDGDFWLIFPSRPVSSSSEPMYSSRMSQPFVFASVWQFRQVMSILTEVDKDG